MVYSTINPTSLKLQLFEKCHRCVGTASIHSDFVASKCFAGLTESDGVCASISPLSQFYAKSHILCPFIAGSA